MQILNQDNGILKGEFFLSGSTWNFLFSCVLYVCLVVFLLTLTMPPNGGGETSGSENQFLWMPIKPGNKYTAEIFSWTKKVLELKSIVKLYTGSLLSIHCRFIIRLGTRLKKSSSILRFPASWTAGWKTGAKFWARLFFRGVYYWEETERK